MSSSYRAICLSHDPGILLYGYDEELCWSDHNAAMAAATHRTGDLADHERCDLVVGRWSGALIEIGCPVDPGGADSRTNCTHREPTWIDARWVRLMIAALAEPTPATTAALKRFPRGTCWHPDRLGRLRNILPVPE